MADVRTELRPDRVLRSDVPARAGRPQGLRGQNRSQLG